MATGYTGKSALKDDTTQTVASLATDQAVSNPWRIQEKDSLYLRVDIVTSAAGATTTLKLQDSWDGLTWFDKKTATVASATTTSITLMPEVAGDQPYLPLRTVARVVATTDATGTATITKITRSFYG